MAEQENADLETEFNALKAVVEGLKGLKPEVQTKIIKYAIETFHLNAHFSLRHERQEENKPLLPSENLFHPHADHFQQGPTIAHIKDLVEAKKPRSANEMAALVAYYLAEHTELASKKNAVDAEDMTTWFKIGGFQLPARIDMTLPNAANAGYFESSGGGKYKLNAIGHNLVVHSMPRGSEAPLKSARRKRAKKVAKKKTK